MMILAAEILGSTLKLIVRLDMSKEDQWEALRLMAEEFRKRDDAAVREFNAAVDLQCVTLDARLAFVEGRLMDVAGLLYRVLKEISGPPGHA